MIYFIAGEVSGDMMGAQVMRQIKTINPAVRFEGVGGSNMALVGIDSLFPMEELSLMGFLEIIPHILHIKRRIRQTAQDIKAKKPDLVVTIDSPGFCYRVASLLRRECPEIKLLHIVAPSVWVYKPGRAKKFADIYDHLLTLLPFEPQYFEKEGLKTTYIGHPIFDTVFGGDQNFRKQHKIKDDSKLVVVTPGSRKGELIRHLPPFIAALNNVARFYEDFTCCFVLTSNQALVTEYLQKATFKYVIVSHQERLGAYAAADVALAKSGTNTLEIAASKTPMVVAYKLNFLTGAVIKLTAKVKYASLINIMGGREIIPEFLQSDCNEQMLAIAIRNILDNDVIASKQIADSSDVLKSMGLGARNSPSKIAAREIMKMVEL
jgi:lipid-A-disaccharide synthase